MATEYVSVTANGNTPSGPEIIIAFYGPRAGTRAIQGVSVEEAKKLRDALTLAIHRLVNKHAFEAVQLGPNGSESILDTFQVTQERSADEAYAQAEALCQEARSLPHNPCAFVREVGATS